MRISNNQIFVFFMFCTVLAISNLSGICYKVSARPNHKKIITKKGHTKHSEIQHKKERTRTRLSKKHYARRNKHNRITKQDKHKVVRQSRPTVVSRVQIPAERVREIQEALKKNGYYSGEITGEYDGLTRTAMVAFQQANGLKATGLPTASSLLKLGLTKHKSIAGDITIPE